MNKWVNKMRVLYLLLCCIIVTFSSCHQGGKRQQEASSDRATAETATHIKYARIQGQRPWNYRLVDVTDPSGESDIMYKYALLKRGTDRKGIPSDYEIIETPVQRSSV